MSWIGSKAWREERAAKKAALGPKRWVYEDSCGLYRTLPPDIKFWQTVTLTPCPKCSSAPTFRFLGPLGLWRIK